MAVLQQLTSTNFGPDARDTINDLLKRQGGMAPSITAQLQSFLARGFRVATLAALATTTVPADATAVILEGYAAPGDAPPAVLRRVSAVEASVLALPSLRTSNDGTVRWMYSEHQELVPQWFEGAKPDATGKTGVGTDSAPGLRMMMATAEGIGGKWFIPHGKWRMSSMINTPSTQRAMLAAGNDSNGRWAGKVYHDLFTDNAGSPVGFYTMGTAGNRIRNFRLQQDGGGLYFPDDAVPIAGSVSRKAGLSLRFCDNAVLFAPTVSGSSYTGFQVTIRASTNVLVVGAYAGLESFPTETGTDGFHVLEGCKGVTIIGCRGRSGDDLVSITEELGANGLTTEDIYIYNCSGSTESGRLLKVHITLPEAGKETSTGATNCTIRNLHVGNLAGFVRGGRTGGGVAILNDARSTGCVIERVYVTESTFNAGPIPKTTPNDGTGGGDAIFVRYANHVWFTNCRMTGSSNAMLTFRDCIGGGWIGGELIPSGVQPNLNDNLVVSGTSPGANGLTRYQFSGAPDLSAALALLTDWGGGNPGIANQNKLPVLRVTGGMNAYNTGDYLIKGVDDANKWVDVESLRPGGSGQTESNITGAAAIIPSKVPDIQVIDSQRVQIDTRISGPLGWCALWIGDRGGPFNNIGINVTLRVTGQTYGNLAFVKRSERGKYQFDAELCRSGSAMIACPTHAAVANAFNEWLDSTDHSGMADSTQGYARTAQIFYSSDRIGKLRGVTPSMLTGARSIASGSTTLPAGNKINVNASAFSGHPLANMDARWITVTMTSNPGGPWWVTYDGAGNFDINLSTAAPAGGVSFVYKLAPPL